MLGYFPARSELIVVLFIGVLTDNESTPAELLEDEAPIRTLPRSEDEELDTRGWSTELIMVE